MHKLIRKGKLSFPFYIGKVVKKMYNILYEGDVEL